MPVEGRRIWEEPVGVPGLEPVNEPLYDTQVYPLAGVAQLVFFTQGLGGRTLRETNVPIAGALPNPQQFHIYGVQMTPSLLGSAVSAAANTVLADLGAIIENSFFRLFIGTKSYVEVASVAVPSGNGISGFAATTAIGTDIAAATNGVAHKNNFYDVTVKIGRSRKPIHLPPQQNFRASLIFPGPAATAITTNVTIGGAAQGGWPLRVFLLGIRWREIQ